MFAWKPLIADTKVTRSLRHFNLLCDSVVVFSAVSAYLPYPWSACQLTTSGDVVLDTHNHVLIPFHHTSMYVFCCAAAESDGRIRVNTLNACTQLLLVLPSTCCESAAGGKPRGDVCNPPALSCCWLWSAEGQPVEARWQQPTMVQRRIQPPSAHWCARRGAGCAAMQQPHLSQLLPSSPSSGAASRSARRARRSR